VVRAGRLAAEYRAEFNSDVVIDLKRLSPATATAKSTIPRHHPAAPLRAHQEPPAALEDFMPNTRDAREAMADSIKKEYEEEQHLARKVTKIPHLRKLPDYWTPL